MGSPSDRPPGMPSRSKSTSRATVSRSDFRFAARRIFIRRGSVMPLREELYQLAIEVEGKLNQDSMVIDFRTMKGILGRICASFDHRTLIPVLHPQLKVSLGERIAHVMLPTKCMELPADGVRCLRVPNITCETLAAHLFEVIEEELGVEDKKRVARLKVTVAQPGGVSASFEARQPADGWEGSDVKG